MVYEIFVLGIVCYLLYRFVFNFVVPIARTARTMQKQFSSMQEQQRGERVTGHQNGFDIRNERPAARPKETGKAAVSKDDYIDFEEVK